MVSDVTTDLKKYELLLLFAPDMSEKDMREALKEIKENVTENHARIILEDVWGLRPLAYRIKKSQEGYYAVLYFESEPSAIIEIRTNVKLHPRVLRHLLLVLPEAYQPKALEDIQLFEEKPRRTREPMRRRPSSRLPETKEIVQEIMTTPKEKLLDEKAKEEKLKSVDKALESILDNPDIEIH